MRKSSRVREDMNNPHSLSDSKRIQKHECNVGRPFCPRGFWRSAVRSAGSSFTVPNSKGVLSVSSGRCLSERYIFGELEKRLYSLPSAGSVHVVFIWYAITFTGHQPSPSQSANCRKATTIMMTFRCVMNE